MKRGPGLFTGYWLDMKGNRLRRIYRNEYGELYRLHRICSQYEKTDAPRIARPQEAPIGQPEMNERGQSIG
jgi:hypothetical protein